MRSKLLKKFVKMLWLVKKSAYVIYEWYLRVSCWRLSEQEYKNLDDTVRMSGWDLRLSRRSTAQHIPNF